MRRNRIYAMIFASLIMVGQISVVAAHGDENYAALARAEDILSAILSVTITSIVFFAIWAPGQVRLRPIQYGIISLGVMTAAIHLLESLDGSPWLTLNGLGSVGLLGALYLPFGILAGVRNQIRWTFIGYTLLTIVLFFVTHPWGMYRNSFEWLGLGTKVVELSLIRLLLLEFKREQEFSFIWI